MPYKDPEKKKESDRLYRLKNKERLKEYRKQYYLDNKEKKKQHDIAYRERHGQKLKDYQKEYYLDNYDHISQSKKDWKLRNAGKVRAYNAKRKAAKKQRVVGWSDELVIQMIYDDCPEGYQVDHIIPLQGKNVSGLHVAWNLQYLTADENLRKGNKYE